MDRKCNLSNFSTTDPRNYKNTPCKATTKRKERKQFRSFAVELVHNTVDKSMDSQAKASLNDSVQKRPTLEAVLASYRSNRTKRVTPEPQNYVSASKHMQTSSFSTTMGRHNRIYSLYNFLIDTKYTPKKNAERNEPHNYKL
jgi:hypothetical protein